MSIGREELDALLRDLDSDDVRTRDYAAEAVADWLEELDEAEGVELGRVLVSRAATEEDHEAFGSLLRALDSLAEYDYLDDPTLRSAAAIPMSADPAFASFLTYLRARAAGADVMGSFERPPS